METLQEKYDNLMKMYNLTKESYENLLLEDKVLKEKYNDLVEMHHEKIQQMERMMEEMQIKQQHQNEDRILKDNESDKSMRFANTLSMIKSVRDDFKRELENNGYVTGLPTGYYDLDYMTRGLHKGELAVLTGRKWEGKTNLVLNIADYILKKEGVMTAIFSIEHSGNQVIRRLLSIELEMNFERSFPGLNKDHVKESVEQRMKEIEKYPLYIDDDPKMSFEKIAEICMGLKLNDNLGLVVIDGVDLMGIEQNELKYSILTKLKETARKTECPILVVSDLSTDGKMIWNCPSGLTQISDLAIANKTADLIMMLHTDESKTDELNNKKEVEMVVAKHQEGVLGKVRLCADLGNIRYKNLNI